MKFLLYLRNRSVKIRTRDILFFSFVTMSMIAMIMFGTSREINFGLNSNLGVTFPTGRVIEVVVNETILDEAGLRFGRQVLLVELISGEHRGRQIYVSNSLFVGHSIYAQIGQNLVIYFEEFPGATDYFARVQSYERASAIYIIATLFIGLLVLVFGKAGLRSGFSLIYTFVVLIFFLVPSILEGESPALLSIFSSLLIISVSLISVMGFGKKMIVSLIGTTLGISFYVGSFLLIGRLLNVSGLHIPEMSQLITIGFSNTAQLGELLFSGILIASLGAIMDVAVSIASITAEIRATNQSSSFKTLFASGMKIGRDLIGSSSNTLILAFTGSFFIGLILFRAYSVDFGMLINQTSIGIEILRAVSASSAMVLTAPATALFGSYLYSNSNNHFIFNKKGRNENV